MITADTYDFLYKKSLPELKKDYTDSLIFNAIRVWKNKGISAEEISDKIDDLKETLARAGKEQFIAIYKTYKQSNKTALYFPLYELRLSPELGEDEQDRIIDKYVEQDEDLDSLFYYGKDFLTRQQINRIIDNTIEKGRQLPLLLFTYINKLLLPEQEHSVIDKYIEQAKQDGSNILNLFYYSKDLLSPEQTSRAIDKAIEQGEDFDYLKQYMTPEQIKLLERKLRPQKQSSESIMLVPMRDLETFVDFKYPDRHNKIPKGHRPFMHNEEEPVREQKEVLPQEEHDMFFGPSYPQNVRQYCKVSMADLKKQALYFPEYEKWFDKKYIDWYVKRGYNLVTLFKKVGKELTDEQVDIAINFTLNLRGSEYIMDLLRKEWVVPPDFRYRIVQQLLDKNWGINLLDTVQVWMTRSQVCQAISNVFRYEFERVTDKLLIDMLSFIREQTIGRGQECLSSEQERQLYYELKQRNVKIGSILDYPKSGLDLSIWTDEGVLKEEIKTIMLDALSGFFDEKGIQLTEVVDDIIIIGSLTTYQYNSKSDLDVHSLIDYEKFKNQLYEAGQELSKKQVVELLDKTWRKELSERCGKVPNTEHPIEFYFELEGELEAKKEDGVYSVLKDEWLQAPRTVDLDYDIAEIYPEVIGYAEGIASEMDIEIGEIKRDIKNIEFLQETIAQLDGEKKKLFKEKLENKVKEIEDSILEIVETGKDVIDKRKKKEYAPESEANVNFKYLQRYGYLWLVKQLGKALEDKTTEEIEVEDTKDVDKVEDVLDRFETEPELCEEIKGRKQALYFPKYEIQLIPELPEEEQEEAIDKAIDKGKDLNYLYSYVGDKFTPQQIDRAIDKGEHLWSLYQYSGKNFTPQQIDKAIDKGEYLEYLYEYVGNKFTPEQIDRAIDKGEDLYYLYGFAGKNFTPQQIDKAIDKGKDLWSLYEHVGKNFTPQQIDKAIDKGKDLKHLYEYVGDRFTPQQKKRYKEKIKKKSNAIESIGFNKQGDYTRFFYDNVGQIIGRIEVAEDGNAFAYDTFGNLVGKSWEGKTFNAQGDIVAQSDILSSLLIREERVIAKKALYFPEYEIKMILELPEKEQGEVIDKAIDKGEYLEYLYEYVGNKFTPEQIDRAIDKGEDLYYLYGFAGKNFTPQQIDKAIDKGKDLWSLYEHVGKNFTPQQIDKAIDKGKDLKHLYEYVGKNFTPQNIDKAMDKGEGLDILYQFVGDNFTLEHKKRYEEKIKKKGCATLPINILIPSESVIKNSYKVYNKDIEPIQVAIIDDNYVIIDGNKRTQAFKNYGYDKIPAKIVNVKKGWRTDFLRDIVKHYRNTGGILCQ